PDRPDLRSDVPARLRPALPPADGRPRQVLPRLMLPDASAVKPVDVLRVEQPGMLATIQDLGRPGRRAAGVPPGGAMDRFALAAANLLVGNPEGSAAIECALSGPSLTALVGCLVAVTGADFGLQRNGRAVPTWTSLFVAPGDRISFAGRRS